MKLAQIKNQMSDFELRAYYILKRASALTECHDDDWGEELEAFLHAFVNLKEEVESEYGDIYPHLLGLKE
jgi:hypothetical protein